MTDTQQTEALRLADRIKSSGQFTNLEELDAAAAELHRLHAENVALQQCYDAARLEIEALRSRQCLHGISEPSGWMPIETAPKDGTLIVLGARNGVWLGKYLPLYGSGYKPENPWSSMLLNHDHMAERYTRPTHWMPLPPPPTTSAVAGQCEDAIELLGKYKELCEEIKRGDSYHIGRIDAAISVLAQAAPVAQGDAQQRAMDARHAAIYRWIIQHIDKAASIIDAWREDGEADKDELHDALAAVAPTPPAQTADSVLEDAARYRFLAARCRSTSEHWGGRWSIIVDGPAPKSHDSEDDFDEAVDAARKQGANHD